MSYDHDEAPTPGFEDLALDTELRELVSAARRGRPEISAEESRAILGRVLSRAQTPHRAEPMRWAATLAAGLAAALALWSVGHRVTAGDDVVVKKLRLECVRERGVARLELTLFRAPVDENEESKEAP